MSSGVGQRLVKLRGSRSQAEFATMLGVHKGTYGFWEREEREIGADALATICRLGWNANWLLTGEGPEQLVDLATSQALGIDLDSLQDAIQVVEEGLTTHRRMMRPAQKAELINEVYLLFVEEGVEAEAIRQKVVRLIRALAHETGEIDG